jgi:hypothetical protein
MRILGLGDNMVTLAIVASADLLSYLTISLSCGALLPVFLFAVYSIIRYTII